MSTRSVIGIVRSVEDEGFGADVVYCHSDGYPEYMLQLLERAYPTLEDAERIVGLGSIASLGMTADPHPTEPKTVFPNEPLPPTLMRVGDPTLCFAPYTRAYCRDYGDSWEENKPYRIKALETGWAKYLWEIEWIKFAYIFFPNVGAWTAFDVRRGAGDMINPTGGDPVLIG